MCGADSIPARNKAITGQSVYMGIRGGEGVTSV